MDVPGAPVDGEGQAPGRGRCLIGPRGGSAYDPHPQQVRPNSDAPVLVGLGPGWGADRENVRADGDHGLVYQHVPPTGR